MRARVGRGLVAIAASGGAMIALAVPTEAGAAASMVANPNPAYVGQSISVGNAANTASTCESTDGPAAVAVTIRDPASTVVFQDTMLIPDPSGNWSVNFTGSMVGTYMASANCHFTQTFAAPQGIPNYQYQDLPIIVQQQQTTTTSNPPTSTTSTTRASSTTSSSINNGGAGNNSGGNGSASASPTFTG